MGAFQGLTLTLLEAVKYHHTETRVKVATMPYLKYGRPGHGHNIVNAAADVFVVVLVVPVVASECPYTLAILRVLWSWYGLGTYVPG